MRLLGKNIINQEILPHLPVYKQNTISKKYGMWRVIECIVYKLKTGVQWHMLPMREFFKRGSVSWESIYYHYNRWCSDGSWERVWDAVMKKYNTYLDLSNINLDGTHSPCKKGGEQVGYQGRKKSKTSNMLLITDNQGSIIASSDPISGEHNDCFEIEKVMSKMIADIQKKGLSVDGLFLNADAGFDSKELRKICLQHEIMANFKQNSRNGSLDNSESYLFDNELYSGRFVIERSNAWIDSFRQLIIRYETKAKNWLGFHHLAFTILFLKNRKIINVHF